jgi:O-antigen/teichoic acid export membrane protein
VYRLQLKFDRTLARRLLAFGVRSHSGNVASLFNERLDQLLISLFLGPSSLGFYVIAVTLTSATMVIGVSTSMVALPAVARLRSLAEQAATARRFAIVTLAGSVIITLPLLATTPALIKIFFGQAFAPAAGPCRILLVATIALSTNRVLGANLRAIGRPVDAGAAELIALAVTAVGLAVLLPSFGLLGAAFTSLLAYLASGGWMILRLSTGLGVGSASLLLPRYQRFAKLRATARASERKSRLRVRGRRRTPGDEST